MNGCENIEQYYEIVKLDTMIQPGFTHHLDGMSLAFEAWYPYFDVEWYSDIMEDGWVGSVVIVHHKDNLLPMRREPMAEPTVGSLIEIVASIITEETKKRVEIQNGGEIQL